MPFALVATEGEPRAIVEKPPQGFRDWDTFKPDALALCDRSLFGTVASRFQRSDQGELRNTSLFAMIVITATQN